MIGIAIDNSSKSPMYTQVGDAICRAIIDGRMAVHDRLPPEKELARTLGLNRLTINRGYKELGKRGILIQRRGAGTFVSPEAPKLLRIRERRKLRNVAFVVPVSSLEDYPSKIDPLCYDFMLGMNRAFSASHVNLCMIPLVQNDDLSSEAIKSRLFSFDGIISNMDLPGISRAEGLVWELRLKQFPMVLLSLRQQTAVFPSVSYDRRKAVSLATEHLIQCGYRRIGYLGAFRGISADEKTGMFLEVFRNHSMSLDTRFHLDVQKDTPGLAHQVMTQFLERQGDDLPDAFFVDTDKKAIETVMALQGKGLRVPEDIGIIGYNDIDDAAALDPPLSTVRTPRMEMGERAARMLMDWPTDGSLSESVVLEPELMVRGTTRTIG
ncbi:MAG: substrate-binding domain-containing protein [Phycisphaerae bacterium]|nr:substrate-binding domain-containing protein [Phycisphaerae bacterium]